MFLGKNGIIGAQVLSFKRLAYKVFTENNIKNNQLGNSGKAMLIYFIILKNEKDLQIIKGVSKNTGLIDTVVKEISEFKRYGISPEALENIDFKNEYLNMKIHDLCLIYKEYEQKINNDFLDSNDELTVLAEVLRNKDKYLNGAKIWIDEFDGFIPQELNIIAELAKKCEVIISMISGEEELFELNNSSIDRIKKACKGCNIDTVFLDKPYRYNNPELEHLEKNIFKVPYVKFEQKTNNIYINNYQNIYEEVESIAKNIIYLVKEHELKNGLRFENVAILTRDIDKYKNVFKMIFSLYNIPFFFDDKKELAVEPIISLILSLLEIISNNYRYTDMFSYLKTGLTNISDENDIDVIENYVLKYGIRGKKWGEDFEYEEDDLEKINFIRAQIMGPILNFKKSFDGRKTVKEIITALFNFLNEIKVLETINAKVDSFINDEDKKDIRYAQEYAQVWNILISIFDEMVSSIGDENISFKDFKTVFKIGVSNHSISVIPSTKDKVIIGDTERTRSNEIRYLFVCGVNDGSFPKVFKNEGFINDNEREILLNNNIEIAKDTKKLLDQEFFNIYKALCVPSDSLFISYPMMDLEGNSLRPAHLINQIKAMFPKINASPKCNVTSREASFHEAMLKKRESLDVGTDNQFWQEVYCWYKENESTKFESTTKGLDFKNTIEYQSKEVSKMLYGDTMNTSVSRLERYMNCPFSFYLTYGLKLKEREVFKLKVPDIGSFLHEIIELFSKRVLEENIDLRTITKEECNDIVDEISDNVLQNFRNNLFGSTVKLRKLSYKLKELVKKTIWLIAFHIKSGNFNIFGSEVEFGVQKEFPPIIVELNENLKLVLSRKNR